MIATLLDNELMQYWPNLTVVQQESVLRVIKSMVHPELGVSIEQYNQEIDEAMKRMDKGHFISQEELENEAEKW